MPELWLQVNSGLCSRLRAVIGAISYCEATGKTLAIDWPRSEPSETLGTFEPRMSDLWHHPYEERDGGGHWSGRMCGQLSDNGSIRFRTCHIEPFLPYMTEPIGNYLNRLRPTERVQKAIDAIYVPNSHPFVGVNIRHSLKQPGASEPSWFIERLSKFPPETHFFGSFDSLEVHRAMKAAFPGRIQTTPKDYVYDFNGIVRTCADLYVLEKCDWVVGSNWSSYSQMVAFMRGAEYVGPHDKPHGLRGGRYEDAWNPPDEAELEKALSERVAA